MAILLHHNKKDSAKDFIGHFGPPKAFYGGMNQSEKDRYLRNKVKIESLKGKLGNFAGDPMKQLLIATAVFLRGNFLITSRKQFIQQHVDLMNYGATRTHIEVFVHTLLNEDLEDRLKVPLKDLILSLLGVQTNRNPVLPPAKSLSVISCRKAHKIPMASTLSSPHVFQTFSRYSRGTGVVEKPLVNIGGGGLHKSQTLDIGMAKNLPKLTENVKKAGRVLGRYMDGTWTALMEGMPKGLSVPKAPLEEAEVIQKNKLMLEHVMVGFSWGKSGAKRNS